MAEVKCKWCEKVYTRTHNSQLYCNSLCKSRAEATRKKLDQMKRRNTLEPRQCRRCGVEFRFYGMKKHCKECLDFLKEKPQAYRKTSKDHKLEKPKEEVKKEPEIRLCLECGKNPRRSTHSRTKYCDECAFDVHQKKIAASNERQKHRTAEQTEELIEKRKVYKDNNRKIDPKWLSRGEISHKGQK